MHELVLDVATYWLLGLAGVSLGLIITARAVTTRLILVDLVALILVATLIVRSMAEGAPSLTAPALALSLLSFVVTVAGARLQASGEVFE